MPIVPFWDSWSSSLQSGFGESKFRLTSSACSDPPKPQAGGFQQELRPPALEALSGGHFPDTAFFPLLSTPKLAGKPSLAGLMFTVEQAVHCTIPGSTIHISQVCLTRSSMILIAAIYVNEVPRQEIGNFFSTKG